MFAPIPSLNSVSMHDSWGSVPDHIKLLYQWTILIIFCKLYRCWRPIRPVAITSATSSSTGHGPDAMQPNTPHASSNPEASVELAAIPTQQTKRFHNVQKQKLSTKPVTRYFSLLAGDESVAILKKKRISAAATNRSRRDCLWEDIHLTLNNLNATDDI